MLQGGRHLAQLNIARLRHPLDDPRVADFVNCLARENAAAERSSGSVWRLKGETATATAVRAFDWKGAPEAQLWKTARCEQDSVMA